MLTGRHSCGAVGSDTVPVKILRTSATDLQYLTLGPNVYTVNNCLGRKSHLTE
jgi:hypothetical protein